MKHSSNNCLTYLLSYTVKRHHSGHLRFLEKVSAIRRCLLYRFLDFFEEKHHVRVVVTGEKVNSGIGLGLEILFDYFFHGDNRVIEWFKKSIEKLDKCTDVKMEKMYEITCEIGLFTKTF